MSKKKKGEKERKGFFFVPEMGLDFKTRVNHFGAIYGPENEIIKNNTTIEVGDGNKEKIYSC